jgi:hypothetical protein
MAEKAADGGHPGGQGVSTRLNEAEEDVLAYMGFPTEH